jgi:probable DNA metabolism protein
MNDTGQGELFDDTGDGGLSYPGPGEAGIDIIAALYAGSGVNPSLLPPNARRLYELSAGAFDTMVHAWMSELPIAAEIKHFEQKILASADTAAAEIAASDRSDPNVLTVLEAAYKVEHEIHRLMGLLRFCPDANGVYVAHCEPDHFVLPSLGPHFMERFGATPWAIIDEKRRLCLRCPPGGTIALCRDGGDSAPLHDDEWGDLWRHYHKTINNESRNNPDLQRQFMPKRYWKYLTELE